MRMKVVIVAMVAAFAHGAIAQTVKVDHFTQSELVEKAQALNPKAQGPDGSASVKLDDYPNSFTMIALRHKDGGAEVHENYADFFYVVQGHATLLSGGTVQDAKTTSPGEIRGASVQNGDRTSLSEGDIVHIPAAVPHQLLLADGSTFIYFVVKVKEK
jgi:mannose-6-phosphate isomerase-like protein (cupin superfamily)